MRSFVLFGLGAALAAPAMAQADRPKCTPPGVDVELAPFALRSILATASYRLLAAAGAAR